MSQNRLFSDFLFQLSPQKSREGDIFKKEQKRRKWANFARNELKIRSSFFAHYAAWLRQPRRLRRLAGLPANRVASLPRMASPCALGFAQSASQMPRCKGLCPFQIPAGSAWQSPRLPHSSAFWAPRRAFTSNNGQFGRNSGDKPPQSTKLSIIRCFFTIFFNSF